MHPKLILIHGMNNNLESFHPLRDKLASHGFEVELLILPGHGSDRKESKDFKSAFLHFDQSMKKLIKDPYVVVAFSQGALFLQLWLEKNTLPRPLGQVLLSPAFYIQHEKKVEKTISTLPAFMFIPSRAPRLVRRYASMFIWEYRTLFESLKKFQALKNPFKIPTLTMIDPKDELLDVKELKKASHSVEFHLEERKYLKGKRPGKYHILFHPNYFEENKWNEFTLKIATFLRDQL